MTITTNKFTKLKGTRLSMLFHDSLMFSDQKLVKHPNLEQHRCRISDQFSSKYRRTSRRKKKARWDTRRESAPTDTTLPVPPVVCQKPHQPSHRHRRRQAIQQQVHSRSTRPELKRWSLRPGTRKPRALRKEPCPANLPGRWSRRHSSPPITGGPAFCSVWRTLSSRFDMTCGDRNR